MRKLLAVSLAAFALVGAAQADQLLGPGRIDSSNRVVLPGGPTLGRWQANRFTATPDAIQIQGQGSTGDVSTMSVTPNTDAALGTLAKALSPLAPSQANPYAPGAYPYFAQGLGSQYGGFTGYYDTKPLATSAMHLPNGSATIFNPFTYGALNTAGALTISTNVRRPGCAQGLTDPVQSAAYDEFGAYALCAQVDSTPLMAMAVGTFTATGFTPSAPIVLSDTVKLGVGMWLRTDDAPAQFNGQVTSWQTNAQGAVTSITVSKWVKRGGGVGTPTGTRAFINPRDKLWGFLNTPFQNGILLQGTTTAGSSVVPVDKTDGLYPNGQLIEGAGVPDSTVIAGIDYTAKIIYLTKAATASGSATLTASTGTEFGKFVGEELDLFNAGVAFKPVWLSGLTANTTTGSYTLTNVQNITAWRPGLVVYGSGIPTGAIVTSVNASNNTMTIKQPATATATGISLRAINQLDEGGTGIDCLSVVKNSNTCFLQRGSVSYGFLSMGAGDTSFLVRPDLFAGLPRYGFRTDGKINGQPTVAAFAVTNDETALWKVDGAGNENAQSVDSATGYKIAGTSVIDNALWTAYTPTVSCSSGTLGTLTSAAGRYKKIGKTVIWSATINVGAKGTCAGSLNVSTPAPANTDYSLTGRDGASGSALTGILPGANSNAIVQRYDGVFPIAATGASTVLLSATYEAQ